MTNTDAYLSNPIWHALTSHHADFAQGEATARRYPHEVAPFGAVETYNEDAFDNLVTLVAEGHSVSVINVQGVDRCKWEVIREFPLIQMVYEGPAQEPDTTGLITPLSQNDVPAMLDLVELVHPGPFRQRTLELGRYFAIWQDGRLAAMAGERFHLRGYREISAVCTHPDYQRRGYAGLLIRHLIHAIHSAGEVPFLHVTGMNTNARKLYEALGFKQREEFTMCVLKRL